MQSTVYSWSILMKLEFSGQFFFFRKILKIENFMKIRQREPCSSMRTDRRTDMTKLIVAFCSCANAPKKNSQLNVL